ncbi:MAG: methionyl-tRNA formyltransferase [Tissierellia bacterium]|nr:methionyl-tRNA formyltransferase [Tissierellia bacterium]
MDIVFMGTPEFAIPALESLYEGGHNIVLVITQKDRPRGRGKKMHPTPVKERALNLGLEVYQPGSVNSRESMDILRKLSPDCIVVAAYGQILKEEILRLPRYGCINIHASLLPRHRGAAPINWALIDGDDVTGITIMEMDTGLDTGDIISSYKIPIEDTDDSQTLHDKLAKIGGQLIVNTLYDLKRGTITKVRQDDSLSTYAARLSKDMGKLDWDSAGDDIINMIRGLKPWPTAYTIYKGLNIRIHKANKTEKFSNEANGMVVKVSDDGIYVNCRDSCIVIEELQFPGKRKMRVSEYLRGNQFDSHVMLG